MEKKAEVLLAMMNCGKKEITTKELLENVSFNSNILAKTIYQLRRQNIISVRREILKKHGDPIRAYYSIKDFKNAKYYLRRNGIPIEDDNTTQ